MESFVFALNAVAPIVIMVAVGYMLKKTGFMTLDIAKAVNRLVFRVFLPVMLFLNVYKITDLGNVGIGYVAYVLSILFVIFLISIPAVMAITKRADRRGVLIQTGFRSNYALIGIPLSQFLFGQEGVAVASLLSAAMIPALNVLAVFSLSMFSDNGKRPNMKKIFLDILKNPLIQGIAAGGVCLVVRAVFVKHDVSFRLTDITSVYTVLTYLSNTATPLALIVLGAQFEFSAVSELKREIFAGVALRNLAVPIIGLGVAYFVFGEYFTGAHFAAFVAAFATPLAVSTVPMSQEMGGDVTLAGQLVVWTTIVSVFSVFVASFLLRLVGVFA